MKPGDLVELDPEILWKGEPHIGIYWSDEVHMTDWGEQVAFECDCLIYWNEKFIPFKRECLKALGEI